MTRCTQIKISKVPEGEDFTKKRQDATLLAKATWFTKQTMQTLLEPKVFLAFPPPIVSKWKQDTLASIIPNLSTVAQIAAPPAMLPSNDGLSHKDYSDEDTTG